MSTDTNRIMAVLKESKCSITQSCSSILRGYNFFPWKYLFTNDFDWYKFPDLSHIFFAVSSPKTFNNTYWSTRQCCIMLLVFLSIFFQSSCDIPARAIPSLIATHCSQSTRKSSILSFHNSKFFWFNFSISICEVGWIASRGHLWCQDGLSLVFSLGMLGNYLVQWDHWVLWFLVEDGQSLWIMVQ